MARRTVKVAESTKTPTTPVANASTLDNIYSNPSLIVTPGPDSSLSGRKSRRIGPPTCTASTPQASATFVTPITPAATPANRNTASQAQVASPSCQPSKRPVNIGNIMWHAHSFTDDGKMEQHRMLFCSVPECGKSFKTKGHLVRHERIHAGEKPYQCDWPDCAQRFTRKDNLRQHIDLHRTKVLASASEAASPSPKAPPKRKSRPAAPRTPTHANPASQRHSTRNCLSSIKHGAGPLSPMSQQSSPGPERWSTSSDFSEISFSTTGDLDGWAMDGQSPAPCASPRPLSDKGDPVTGNFEADQVMRDLEREVERMVGGLVDLDVGILTPDQASTRTSVHEEPRETVDQNRPPETPVPAARKRKHAQCLVQGADDDSPQNDIEGTPTPKRPRQGNLLFAREIAARDQSIDLEDRTSIALGTSVNTAEAGGTNVQETRRRSTGSIPGRSTESVEPVPKTNFKNQTPITKSQQSPEATNALRTLGPDAHHSTCCCQSTKTKNHPDTESSAPARSVPVVPKEEPTVSVALSNGDMAARNDSQMSTPIALLPISQYQGIGPSPPYVMGCGSQMQESSEPTGFIVVANSPDEYQNTLPANSQTILYAGAPSSGPLHSRPSYMQPLIVPLGMIRPQPAQQHHPHQQQQHQQQQEQNHNLQSHFPPVQQHQAYPAPSPYPQAVYHTLAPLPGHQAFSSYLAPHPSHHQQLHLHNQAHPSHQQQQQQQQAFQSPGSVAYIVYPPQFGHGPHVANNASFLPTANTPPQQVHPQSTVHVIPAGAPHGGQMAYPQHLPLQILHAHPSQQQQQQQLTQYSLHHPQQHQPHQPLDPLMSADSLVYISPVSHANQHKMMLSGPSSSSSVGAASLAFSAPTYLSSLHPGSYRDGSTFMYSPGP